MRALDIALEEWSLREPLRIARETFHLNRLVLVTLAEAGAVGRGECCPTGHYGETPASVIAQIESVRPAIEAGAGREELAGLLPPGAARNALDCALWDLEAKRSRRTIWELAGIPRPQSVVSAVTIFIDDPAVMARHARRVADCPMLKVKLSGQGSLELERLAEVRNAAPRARLIVDANEAWDADLFTDLAPRLAALGVELLEQPLRAGADGVLEQVTRPLAVAADESCHTTEDLAGLVGRYDVVNIKLDKTGGLTEALRLAAEARRLGLGVMVGCMGGSSLAMAPAMVVAALADVADLDAPLLQARDREHAIRYASGVMHGYTGDLWG